MKTIFYEFNTVSIIQTMNCKFSALPKVLWALSAKCQNAHKWEEFIWGWVKKWHEKVVGWTIFGSYVKLGKILLLPDKSERPQKCLS